MPRPPAPPLRPTRQSSPPHASSAASLIRAGSVLAQSSCAAESRILPDSCSECQLWLAGFSVIVSRTAGAFPFKAKRPLGNALNYSARPAGGRPRVTGRLSDRRDRLLHHRLHLFGKRRIPHAGGLALAVLQHPLQEALHRSTLRRIGELLGNQQPGKAGDRIR